MIVLAVIVAAAAPFLWRATQGAGPSSAETKRIASEVSDESAPVRHDDSVAAPAYASLDEDFPPPRTTMDAPGGRSTTQQWFTGKAVLSGGLPRSKIVTLDLSLRLWSSASIAFSLDAAAYSMERAAPEAFQAADAASNPYFTPDEFAERQLRFAPPNNPALSAEAQQRRKGDVLAALTMMLNTAGESAVEEGDADAQAN